MTLLLSLFIFAGAPSQSCEQRCTGSVKICSDTCEKNFPKAQLADCKKACESSVAPCKDHCKNPQGGAK